MGTKQLAGCPSCTGHGHHGNGADCSTCTGLGRVDLALLRWPCTLDFAAAYAAEWSLGAYDYTQADDVVAHLDDRGQRDAAWVVALHSLTSNAGDRIRACWSCRVPVLDGECEDCAEYAAEAERKQAARDAYENHCDNVRKERREEGSVAA